MENETTTSLPFSPKVGDCVLLKPSEPEEQPYVAKVIDLDNKGQVKLRWFYRPEDVKGGRRRWHGKQELFRSNACDWNPIACIESFCRVLSLEKYELLTKVSPSNTKPSRHSIFPSHLPIQNNTHMLKVCHFLPEWSRLPQWTNSLLFLSHLQSK